MVNRKSKKRCKKQIKKAFERAVADLLEKLLPYIQKSLLATGGVSALVSIAKEGMKTIGATISYETTQNIVNNFIQGSWTAVAVLGVYILSNVGIFLYIRTYDYCSGKRRLTS